jgi:hypothetical protein
MEDPRTGDFAKILGTNTSRRRALKAVAGSASGTGSASRLGQRSTSARAALDPVAEAGRRLTAVVHDEQVPLPTVRLPAAHDGEQEGQ